MEQPTAPLNSLEDHMTTLPPTTRKALPRGMTIATYKTKGGTVEKYRVKVKKGTFKLDKTFDSYEEANEALLLTKPQTGKILIEQNKKEQEELEQQAWQYIAQPTLEFYINKYIQAYIDVLPSNTELERRKKTTLKAFYTIIKRTEIEYTNIQLNALMNEALKIPKTKISNLKPIDLTDFEINQYIKERLKLGIKKSSVAREIGHISKFYQKLKYIDKTLKDIPNPVEKYDRDLLKEKTTRHEYRLDPQDRQILFEEIEKHPNRELEHIVKIALLTAMRRSEIVFLTWGQVYQNYVLLDLTKTNPRKVWLTIEAQNYFAAIKPENTKREQRLFTYTLTGFEQSFNHVLDRINPKLTEKLNFKALRKETISFMLESMGQSSSIVASTFFGISNLKKFEQTFGHMLNNEPTNQSDLLKSFGHASGQTTKNFYYSKQQEKKPTQE